MSERITWHVDVPPNTSVHVESSSQEVETCIVPVSKHDGSLGGEIAAEAKVEYDSFYRVKHISINGGYGYIESRDVTLDAKQALSLLAWLRQEEETLKGLAKEQVE